MAAQLNKLAREIAACSRPSASMSNTITVLLHLVQAGTGNQQHFSVIKSKQQEQPGQKQIPSMFKLEPSEEQQRLDGMKQQLLSALQPNPETIAAVGKDETLSAGNGDIKVCPPTATAVMTHARSGHLKQQVVMLL